MSKLSPDKEFERRFLLRVRAFPASLKRDPQHILQGYLAVAPTQVRVRIIDGHKAHMDVKGRDDFELDPPILLDLKRAKRLLEPDCRMGSLIDKDRYEVPASFDGLLWEIDFFKGDNGPLRAVEIETPTKKHKLDRAEFPEWVGHEITGDADLEPYLKNRALAMRPFRFLPKHVQRRITRYMNE